MKFLLTPHTYAILAGNDLPEDSSNFKDGRGMKLVCEAPRCLHDAGTGDKIFERKIKVKGFTVCSRCGKKSEEMEFCALAENDTRQRKQIPTCPFCGKKPVKITYTQYVFSKHRRSRHYYYHFECYEAMFLGESAEGFVPKRYKTRYAGAHGGGCIVYLPFDPRKGVCEGCGKSVAKGEIKCTSLHHWKYAFKPATVQANPVLVLENTSELCFACHRVADGLRNLMALGNERIINVASLMPKDLIERFASICKLFLYYKDKMNENDRPS
jgi:hypothetical protein